MPFVNSALVIVVSSRSYLTNRFLNTTTKCVKLLKVKLPDGHSSDR